MNDSDSIKRATAAALRFLAYRSRSEAEVRTRLRRHFPSHVVEQVIQDLSEQDLLDDSKFAASWAESRDSNKPRSAYKIRRELVSKGVEKDIAGEAVRHLDDEDSAYRAGLKFARKLRDADHLTFRRRLWGYLRRRGFSESVARQTIKRLWSEQRGDDTLPF
jgi:regulatory protein